MGKYPLYGITKLYIQIGTYIYRYTTIGGYILNEWRDVRRTIRTGYIRG